NLKGAGPTLLLEPQCTLRVQQEGTEAVFEHCSHSTAEDGPACHCNLHDYCPRPMRIAKGTAGLDWFPGGRSADPFPTLASQNCQRKVIAGKRVASFSGRPTGVFECERRHSA